MVMICLSRYSGFHFYFSGFCENTTEGVFGKYVRVDTSK